MAKSALRGSWTPTLSSLNCVKFLESESGLHNTSRCGRSENLMRFPRATLACCMRRVWTVLESWKGALKLGAPGEPMRPCICGAWPAAEFPVASLFLPRPESCLSTSAILNSRLRSPANFRTPPAPEQDLVISTDDEDPAKGRLRRSGEIPTMRPQPCRYEVFYPSGKCCAQCTTPKNQARACWLGLDSVVGVRKPSSRNNYSVERPESATWRAHPRDLSTPPQSLRFFVVGRDDRSLRMRFYPSPVCRLDRPRIVRVQIGERCQLSR